MSENEYSDVFNDACERATADGFIVIRSTECVLLLDIDNGAAMDAYDALKMLAESLFGVEESERWRSKSGKGWHVVLKSPRPLSMTERLLLQCALGSDPKREMLGLHLHRMGVENCSVLFKPGVK